MFTQTLLVPEVITPFSMLLIGVSFTAVLFSYFGKDSKERERRRKRRARYHYLMRKLRRLAKETEVKEEPPCAEEPLKSEEEPLPPLEQQDVKIE